MTYALLNTNWSLSEVLNPALLFGLIVFGGALGARAIQILHVPQVVGCIVVGILLGDILGLISDATIESLEPFTMFALGVIGFMIGSELRAEVFKKYGKQFFIILIAQGVGAFLLVSIATSFIMYILEWPASTSVAVGLVLGAIASATAPAATVNVLWEYKTRGPLTAAVLAIVALDDALALLLYRAAASGADALLGTGKNSVLATSGLLLAEIFGAILLGFISGLLLYLLLKLVRAEDKILEFSIASLLLLVGISMVPRIDPILPAMTLGITMANLAPRESKHVFNLVGGFSPPVYIAFFVLAGAHMEFGTMALWIVFMIATFVVLRAVGKISGAWAGAKYSKAPAVVRKYLGICLLPQAGVAIGLAILAKQKFAEDIGKLIIIVVMTATFLMEVLGPLFVKLGVKKAGEVGLNITEGDLIKTYKVNDVMNPKPVNIRQDTPLPQILEIFSSSDSLYYPVVDNNSRLIGVITISDIREMFANQDVAGWLLACDVAEPVLDKTTPEKPLEEAIERMQRYDLEHMAVVKGKDKDEIAGILDRRLVHRHISAEVLRRRKVADEMALATG